MARILMQYSGQRKGQELISVWQNHGNPDQPPSPLLVPSTPKLTSRPASSNSSETAHRKSHCVIIKRSTYGGGWHMRPCWRTCARRGMSGGRRWMRAWRRSSRRRFRSIRRFSSGSMGDQVLCAWARGRSCICLVDFGVGPICIASQYRDRIRTTLSDRTRRSLARSR